MDITSTILASYNLLRKPLFVRFSLEPKSWREDGDRMADVDSEVPADSSGMSDEPRCECGDECECGVPPLDAFTEYAAEHGIESQALVDILQIAASWLEKHHFMALVDPSSDEVLARYALHGWQEGYCQAIEELRDATQELVAIDVPDDASELFKD